MGPNSNWAQQQREQGMRAAAYAAKQQEDARKRAAEYVRIAREHGREPTPEEIDAAMRAPTAPSKPSAGRRGLKWLFFIFLLPVLLAGLAGLALSVVAFASDEVTPSWAIAFLAGSLLATVVAFGLLRKVARIGR